MNQGRHAAQFRRQQHRPRGVAADAENNSGLMSADEFERLRKAGRQAEESFDRVAEAFAFQAADGDELERETGLRNDRLFESALGADEDDAALRIARDELARNGDRGIDMPARPPSRDHQRLAHLSPRA